MIDSPLLGLLLLGALAAAPLLLRRMRGATPTGLRVMARTGLHKGAVVAVVAVGDRRLLLGAGEKGVQLLAELDTADADAVSSEPTDGEHATDIDLTTSTTELVGRTDADRHLTTTDTGTVEALEALIGPPGSSGDTAGPRNGLLDRLRAMTVRATPPPHSRGAGEGRPIRVPLRR